MTQQSCDPGLQWPALHVHHSFLLSTSASHPIPDAVCCTSQTYFSQSGVSFRVTSVRKNNVYVAAADSFKKSIKGNQNQARPTFKFHCGPCSVKASFFIQSPSCTGIQCSIRVFFSLLCAIPFTWQTCASWRLSSEDFVALIPGAQEGVWGHLEAHSLLQESHDTYGTRQTSLCKASKASVCLSHSRCQTD